MSHGDGPNDGRAASRSTLGKILRFFLPIGLIAGSIVVMVALVAVNQSQRPERREDAAEAILVEAVPIDYRTLNFTVDSQGAVEPRTRTVVVSEVAGKVVEVSPKFIAGGFFEAGEMLLRIDPSDYQTAVKRAEAGLAARRATLAEEQARSEQALRDWRNLGRKGEPSELVLRKPQLADARANVQAAEADLEKARRDLQRTRIALPYDGLVRDKAVDIGQYVAPGTPLGTTFATDVAEIRLPLSSSDLAYLDLPSFTGPVDGDSSPVTLMADDRGVARSWSAQVVRTEGVVDAESRVIYAIAQLPDPYGVLGESPQQPLQFGTFVRAEIVGRQVSDVAVLPRSVLRPDGTVAVATPEGELAIREVTLLRADPDRVYIDSGLQDSDRVVTTALDAAIPGTRLAIAGEESADAIAEEGDGADSGTEPDNAVAAAGSGQ